MNILFVSNDPSIFDAASPTRARMREIASNVDALHIISRAFSSAKPEDDGTLHLHPFHGGRISSLLSMPGKVCSIVKKHAIDVVSAQDPFEHGWIAKKGIRGTQARLHLQVHTDFLSPWFTRSGNFRSLKVRMPFLNKVRQHIADSVIPSASGIRTVSERIKSSLISRYGTRIPEPSVIPVAVPHELPPKVELPKHDFGFVFLTVGRLEPEKRIEDIFMALGRLGPRLHSVGLMIVGEGRERKGLETFAEKLGLSKRVLFLGARHDAWGLLQNAHAYIQTSAYEGYGRTLVEAALAKVPIITTDVGIVGEVFKGYEDVLSVPPADPVNIAAQMNALLGNHQLRATLTMNAEQKVKAHLAKYDAQPTRIARDLSALIQTP